MIDELDTAVIELDQDDRIGLINVAAESGLATGRDRARGLRLHELNGIPESLLEAVSHSRADGRRRHLIECALAGGRYDCNIRPLENQHILLELYDMRWEERRQQLQQREVQTGMLDLLRRNLGHEIRNPLGGIRGAAQMLADELDSQELGTLAQLIMREVDRVDELLQRFGRTELDIGEVDIHQVCDEAIDLVHAESGRSVRIQRDFDPSIPEISADGAALRQVLLNLVLNAHQAKSSCIRIRTRVEHGTTLLHPGQTKALRIDIEDDGDGVPEHIRPMLFLPLVTGRRDGTGLGLALSQQIAAAHGGLITYAEVGEGSCFSVFLPPAASPRVTHD